MDRLATVSLRFLNWQPENVASFSHADTLFHLSGVFAKCKWERYLPKPYRKRGTWVQIEKPSGLYLKLKHTDAYHRLLATQSLGDAFSVLPWPHHSRKTLAVIPRARTQLGASRMRTAKTLEDLPDAPWQESSTIHERKAHALHDESRDPRVLHMIVLDRTGGDLARLKDNLALAFLYAEQLDVSTPRAIVAAEIRRLLDEGTAPDFGVADTGLLGIPCGAIEAPGESFRQRCVALVETLADVDLVASWGHEKGKR
ncbi:hypothetical protein B0H19DRAFT_1252572 [Mycena capillaripes]|nr:hypothetical protein B0H19DRAFT_1252572 [Mycena capillaripes]